MYTALFIFVLWFPFAVILADYVKGLGGEFANPLKRFLYVVLAAPVLWIEFLRARTYRGTVGLWFSALAHWLKE